MESLKEFSAYTRRSMSIRYSYAVRRNAIEFGMSPELLVENAGEAVSDSIVRRMKGDRILVVCGSGEKGAIGLAAARHLANSCDVRVILLGGIEEVHNQTSKFNIKMLDGLIEVVEIGEHNIDVLSSELKNANAVLEAIAGIGVHGRISGVARMAIQEINSSKKKVISIDVPAGINGDTGETNVAYIKADELLALHKVKKGLIRSKAVGSIIQLDVGIPLLAELGCGPGDFTYLGLHRSEYANKYSSGRLLIVGGGRIYRGAPVLAGFAANAAFAALRSGTGYVTIAVPERIEDRLGPMAPGLIIRSIPEGKGASDVASELNSIKHNVMVVGPGLESKDIDFGIINRVVHEETSKKNIVLIDGGAIKPLKDYRNMFNRRMILTPHDGEFKELTGINLEG
ncbi:MAG: NAD(P)H-hydrate epimerase, partial [Candidatus Micrarchaeaceae archaeon]